MYSDYNTSVITLDLPPLLEPPSPDPLSSSTSKMLKEKVKILLGLAYFLHPNMHTRSVSFGKLQGHSKFLTFSIQITRTAIQICATK